MSSPCDLLPLRDKNGSTRRPRRGPRTPSAPGAARRRLHGNGVSWWICMSEWEDFKTDLEKRAKGLLETTLNLLLSLRSYVKCLHRKASKTRFGNESSTCSDVSWKIRTSFCKFSPFPPLIRASNETLAHSAGYNTQQKHENLVNFGVSLFSARTCSNTPSYLLQGKTNPRCEKPDYYFNAKSVDEHFWQK